MKIALRVRVMRGSGIAALAGGATATTSLIGVSGLATATSVGFASVAAAAVGGFAGSVASQLVGKALGAVDSFSLRGAVAGGLTAGFTAGVGTQLGSMGQLIDKGKWGSVAASAAMSSAGAYVAGRMAGLDTSFSWRSIAASAVTAVVSGKINKSLGTVLEGPGLSNGMLNDTLGGIVNGVVSLHTRRAFGFDDQVDYGSIAVDAFGNALGNALSSLPATLQGLRQQRLDGYLQNSMDQTSREISRNGEIKMSQDLELDQEARMAGASMRNRLNLEAGTREIGALAQLSAQSNAKLDRNFDRSIAATEARLHAEALAAARQLKESNTPIASDPSWRDMYNAYKQNGQSYNSPISHMLETIQNDYERNRGTTLTERISASLPYINQEQIEYFRKTGFTRMPGHYYRDPTIEARAALSRRALEAGGNNTIAGIQGFVTSIMGGDAVAIQESMITNDIFTGPIMDAAPGLSVPGRVTTARISGSSAHIFKGMINPHDPLYARDLTLHESLRIPSSPKVPGGSYDEEIFVAAGYQASRELQRGSFDVENLENFQNYIMAVQLRRSDTSDQTVILDNNIASSFNRRAHGEELKQEIQNNAMRKLDNLMLDKSDLRITDTVAVELRDLTILNKGINLTTSRQSLEYKEFLKSLAEGDSPVGRRQGIRDRFIVADVFFAKGNGIPTLITSDKGIYNPLAKRAGINPEKTGGMIAEKNPYGFNVTINGRTIKVLPISSGN